MDKFRLTSHQAADFFEGRLFFRAEGMRVLAGLKEFVVVAAKVVTSGVSRNQIKVLVEFVPDGASDDESVYALCHIQSKDTMFHDWTKSLVVLIQCPVQIAAR